MAQSPVCCATSVSQWACASKNKEQQRSELRNTGTASALLSQRACVQRRPLGRSRLTVPPASTPSAASGPAKSGGKRAIAPENTADQWQFYTVDSPGIKVYVPCVAGQPGPAPGPLADAARRSPLPRPAASLHSAHSGPVPVLVMSLVFIASVFMLHIWAKFSG